MSTTAKPEDALEIGDRVFDKEAIGCDDLPSLGVVVGLPEKRCGDIKLTNADTGKVTPLHQYGDNVAYADGDTPVAAVVFASWLDGHIPQWRAIADEPEKLTDRIHMMRDDFGIPVERGTYQYPVTRLKLSHRP